MCEVGSWIFFYLLKDTATLVELVKGFVDLVELNLPVLCHQLLKLTLHVCLWVSNLFLAPFDLDLCVPTPNLLVNVNLFHLFCVRIIDHEFGVRVYLFRIKTSLRFVFTFTLVRFRSQLMQVRVEVFVRLCTRFCGHSFSCLPTAYLFFFFDCGWKLALFVLVRRLDAGSLVFVRLVCDFDIAFVVTGMHNVFLLLRELLTWNFLDLWNIILTALIVLLWYGFETAAITWRVDESCLFVVSQVELAPQYQPIVPSYLFFNAQTVHCIERLWRSNL